MSNTFTFEFSPVPIFPSEQKLSDPFYILSVMYQFIALVAALREQATLTSIAQSELSLRAGGVLFCGPVFFRHPKISLRAPAAQPREEV